MFGDFVTCCTDALVNHAAKLQYMYAGQVKVPLTAAGCRSGAATATARRTRRASKGLFLNVPGLRVDVSGVPCPMRSGCSAVRCAADAPVLFLEPKLLYPKRGPMPAVRPRRAARRGARSTARARDLTLITYGLCLELCREAADALAARGHSVEIVDLRSLAPFDRAACVTSVQKTGRAVVVQESSETAGVADMVIGAILPEVFGWLRAPLSKVGAEHCPIPSSPELEELVMPSARKVSRLALQLLTEY